MRRIFASLPAWLSALVFWTVFPDGAVAEPFRLSAPQSLVESGFLGYVLPRFSLKTGVRIDVVDAGTEAEIALLPEGRGQPVFTGQGRTWRMRPRAPDHDGAARFAEWLVSKIGRRTISSFRPGGAPLFTPAEAAPTQEEQAIYAGDAARGLNLSQAHCGRCHVVSAATRMTSIGSTPSFFLLRGLKDWQGRFASFHAINPHPAFTQVAGVSAPFPAHLPPPIRPLEITVEELEDILAYVAGLTPADLGAPLQHQ